MKSVESIARDCGYEFVSTETLKEIDGSATMLLHPKSGAKLLLMQNDDVNKAFSISFKTPPRDDTGVFHILEHSVLCGSRKFPVKEPFVDLLKSSMQTFLNAMTFPDKTMYPVASTNEKDLLNLMDVYLDAVFHPAIYTKPTIFQQEGWHFEREGENGANLAINGVVYNEMKGELSNPDSVLYDGLSAALFPDNAYRFESGGTPEGIATLTYEGFLDHHRRHYRTDNSFITLYGDFEPETFLRFLDEAYLSPVAEEQADVSADVSAGISADVPADVPQAPNPLLPQEPLINFDAKRTMETAPENACCALGYVIGNVKDRERLMATDVLLDAIMGSNEAPMKRAILDAGIAADAMGYVADATLQPFAVIHLKGLRPDGASKLRPIVEAEAKRLADGELDHALIEAALSHTEFVLREHDFGTADGVVLAMSCLSGWLYDDSLATAYIRYEDAFEKLREQISQGYFEQLLRELFLENNHAAGIEVVPVSGDGAGEAAEGAVLGERESASEGASESTNESTSETTDETTDGTTDGTAPRIPTLEEVDELVAALRCAQETPDSAEDLATLPRLAIADIDEAPAEPRYWLDERGPFPCLLHEVNTHGIAYSYRYFSLDCVQFDELPLVSVLAMVLGKLGTANHSAADLDTAIQASLGNLSFFAEVHENADDAENIHPFFVLSASSLSSKLEEGVTLCNEVLTSTIFNDPDRIYDILCQRRVGMEQAFATSGHSSAMTRVGSYYLPAGVVREALAGIDFYRYLCDLIDHFDERAPQLIEELEALAKRLLVDTNCMMSFGGSEEDFERFVEVRRALGEIAPEGEAGTSPTDAPCQKTLALPKPQPKNEAFIVPSDVSFSALGFDRRKLGADYTGSWLVAARALSYDYLWNEVRVKGGAYGVGFQTTRQGNMRFYSFRDPHVAETYERFHDAASWLAEFSPSDEEMTGYVVSTVAGIDSPVKPRSLIRRQDAQFLAHLSPQSRAQSRAEVLTTAAEDVRALSPVLESIVEANLHCSIGNAALIEQCSADFLSVEPLSTTQTAQED